MLSGQSALIVAAAFAGAAIYVSTCEHPARMTLDDGAALTQWKPAYARGTIMQGGLALVGTALGIIAWWQTGRLLWLFGAAALLANWPFTLFVIMPINNALKATDIAQAGAHSRAQLHAWSRLHAVRCAFGIASTALFLSALMTPVTLSR